MSKKETDDMKNILTKIENAELEQAAADLLTDDDNLSSAKYTGQEFEAMVMKKILEKLDNIGNTPSFSINDKIKPHMDEDFKRFLSSVQNVGFKNMLYFSEVLLESIKSGMKAKDFTREDLAMSIVGVCDEIIDTHK